MDISIRNHIGGCVGVTTFDSPRSVLRDMMGMDLRTLPPDPTGIATEVSLRDRADRLRNPRVHLNIIKVGIDIWGPGDESDVDYAVHRTRLIFRQQDLEIARVQHHEITAAQAGGFAIINSNADVWDLVGDWTVPNDGIDVFVPHQVNGFLGLAPPGGPDENGKGSGKDGLVTMKNHADRDQIARTMAHEVGHYLGLGHRNNQRDNLMCQSDEANNSRTSVDLTDWQGGNMANHHIVQAPC
ncbi:MAG: zinc-dependent metalloprotease family protein [Acidobacteriota bacterium]